MNKETICPFCNQPKGNPDCGFCKQEETQEETQINEIKTKTSVSADQDSVCSFCNQPKGNPDCGFCKHEGIQTRKQDKSVLQIDQKLKEKAPQLIKLVEKVDITLKQKNLVHHKARVALCLDISGSMASLYSSGKVQMLAEKVLALGCRFDDNGTIDIFLFGTGAYEAGEMSLDNFRDFIREVNKRYRLEGGTYYGRAMEMIRGFYFPDKKGLKRDKPLRSSLPVYVMFLTDGETHDRKVTEHQIQWAAYEPIFWQFMGIGESKKDVKSSGIRGFLSKAMKPDFSFLEQLDEMEGRFVDNAGFFSVKDPHDIPDEDLYNLLMSEYPEWLKLARSKGLL